MGVQVDQPGHDPGVTGVDDLVALGDLELALWPDRLDQAVLHQYHRIVDAAAAVGTAHQRLGGADRESTLGHRRRGQPGER